MDDGKWGVFFKNYISGQFSATDYTDFRRLRVIRNLICEIRG